MTDPLSISRTLLAPGPAYLISAFQAGEEREARLADAAEVFDLRAALGRSEPAVQGERNQPLGADTDTYTDRWLRLLRRAVANVTVPTTRAELDAIVRALEEAARGRGNGGSFWEQAATHLKGSSISAGTLRHRRWPTIRMRLAEELAQFVPPLPSADVLPHEPLTPGLFHDASFAALLDKLNGDYNGLAVLVGEVGTGKSEFAVAYADWARKSYEGKARYDHVLWLRADDLGTLEQDYLKLGRVLDPSRAYNDPADIIAVLQSTDRWLLIFDDVRDPPLLLRYLPRQLTGHVICTADISFDRDAVDRCAVDELLTDRLRDHACRPWQHYFAVPLADRDAVDLPGRLELPELERFLAFYDIKAGDRSKELLEQLGSSRLALNLAATWLRVYGNRRPEDVTKYLGQFNEARRTIEALAIASSDVERVGLIAAYTLLDHARVVGRHDFDGESKKDDDESAFVLVQRLESFAPHAIPIEAVRDEVVDQRLMRLEELGLVVRHQFFDRQCFDLHRVIRQAMTHLMTPDERHNALAVAALTALRLSSIDLTRPRRAMQPTLLPHAVWLADRLASPQAAGSRRLPVTSVELATRAAASFWLAGMPSHAAKQIRKTKDLLGEDSELRKVVLDDLQARRECAWDMDLPEHAARLLRELDLQTPFRRLLQLIAMLRRVGFYSGATKLFTYVEPLVEDWAHSAPETQRSEADDARAKLALEGALCLRESGDLDGTKHQLRQAHAHLYDPSDLARYEAMVGLEAQDRGDLRTAIESFGSSVERRMLILQSVIGGARATPDNDDTSDEQQERAWQELARGYSALARGLADAYLPQATAAAASRAVTCWSRSAGAPLIGRATARSTLALALAIQRHPSAARLADAAVEEAEGNFGPDHHRSALIRLNQAQVLIISDDPVAAVDVAEPSFRTVVRHWPRRHPLVLGARLTAAHCRSDAGRASDALDHLFVLLDDAGLEAALHRDSATMEPESLRLPAMRAVAWTAIGNLLLDASTHVVVEADTDLELGASRHARAPECLDAAERCFRMAHRLLDEHGNHSVTDVLGENGHSEASFPPRMIEAGLGLLEVQIRRGKPDGELARQLVESAQASARIDRYHAVRIADDAALFHRHDDQVRPDVIENDSWPESISELRALAKLVRASNGVRVSLHWDDQRISPFISEFWERLLNGGDPPAAGSRALSVRDRTEFALAWQKVLLDEHGFGSVSPGGEERFAAITQWLTEDLVEVRSIFADGPHQQIAIRYSILAQCPDSSGKNHRRARNLREVERYRVLLAESVIDNVSSRLNLENELLRNAGGVWR